MTQLPNEAPKAMERTLFFENLTTRYADLRADGLDNVSYAKCEDIKSVSEKRIIARLGTTSPDALFAIGRALRFLIDV